MEIYAENLRVTYNAPSYQQFLNMILYTFFFVNLIHETLFFFSANFGGFYLRKKRL